MLIPMSETLAFGATDAAATYLSLIETAKGGVPWWATGHSRDWTPACIDDTVPLKGAERAVVTAAILASPTGRHLGRWWQVSHLAATPSAAIEILTPGLRWLRPYEPDADIAVRDAASPVDLPSIIDRLFAVLSATDGAARVAHPAIERGKVTMRPTTLPGQKEAELAVLVERMALAYARMDGDPLSRDALAHVLISGLTAAFALASLGVDPCAAHINCGVQPGNDLTRITGFDTDRQVASLIGAADAAERMSERILEPIHPTVRDIMAERPRVPTPSQTRAGSGASGRDPRTLAQVVAQAQCVSRLLDRGSTRAS